MFQYAYNFKLYYKTSSSPGFRISSLLWIPTQHRSLHKASFLPVCKNPMLFSFLLFLLSSSFKLISLIIAENPWESLLTQMDCYRLLWIAAQASFWVTCYNCISAFLTTDGLTSLLFSKQNKVKLINLSWNINENENFIVYWRDEKNKRIKHNTVLKVHH